MHRCRCRHLRCRQGPAGFQSPVSLPLGEYIHEGLPHVAHRLLLSGARVKFDSPPGTV